MTLRYRTRLLLMFVGLFVVTGVLTSLAILNATKQQRMADADQQLRTASKVLDQALSSRAGMLSSSVSALTSDFGFRQAVATRESETIALMLLNHGARIDADIGAVVSLDGRITSTTDAEVLDGRFAFDALLQAASDGKPTTDVVALSDGVYQIVIAPIFLPQQVGWACIGFRIDNALVDELAALTGLEVSFSQLAEDGGNAQVLVSTNAEAAGQAANGLQGQWLNSGHAVSRFVDSGVVGFVQIGLDDVLDGYYELRAQLMVVFAVTLLVSILASVLLARRVSEPLSRLMSFAKNIRRGNYDIAAEVHSTDEFGVLAETLEEMREGIAEREARITHQLYHDGLTGLSNIAATRLEIQRRIDAGEAFALVHFRVDRFSEFNEVLGSELGDELLIALSQRLTSLAEDNELVACKGVRRFSWLAAFSDEPALEARIAAMQEALQVPVSIGNVTANIVIAAGAACYPQHAENADALIRRADIALSSTHAENARRCIYLAGQEEDKRRRLIIVNDLKAAIDTGQLHLEYQPKIKVSERHCDSVEALVRWRHPEHGMMRPDQFIMIAEQTGLIGHLTRWLVATVAEQIARWEQQGLTLSVAINLSALDLANASLPALIDGAMRQHNVDPARLTLEITESAVIADRRLALANLDALASAGYKIAIDDFGTGHSSMAQLASLPATELKIDKSFIQLMEADAKTYSIVRSMMSLARSMAMQVVAEGVETASIWRLLQDMQCETIQGFLISKPLPVDEVARWLGANTPVRCEGLDDETGRESIVKMV